MSNSQHEQWTLYGSGALPLTRHHAPILLKLAIVFAFKWKQGPVESSMSKGVGAAFMPLGLTFLVWILMALPSLCIKTKNSTASICYVIFGSTMFITYSAGITLSILLQPEATIFLAGSAAMHFAYFVSSAHPSALHGANIMHSCMLGFICIWMYYCVNALPVCLHVPDVLFLVYMWAPEAVNMVINCVMTRILAMLLDRSTAWRLVGTKED
jgi:hypothetical protein